MQLFIVEIATVIVHSTQMYFKYFYFMWRLDYPWHVNSNLTKYQIMRSATTRPSIAFLDDKLSRLFEDLWYYVTYCELFAETQSSFRMMYLIFIIDLNLSSQVYNMWLNNFMCIMLLWYALKAEFQEEISTLCCIIQQHVNAFLWENYRRWNYNISFDVSAMFVCIVRHQMLRKSCT